MENIIFGEDDWAEKLNQNFTEIKRAIKRVSNNQITFDGDIEGTSKWFTGNTINGTITEPTVFASSNIPYAYIDDYYLNNDNGNVYRCMLGGDAMVATWSYVTNLKGDMGSRGSMWHMGIDITSTDDTNLIGIAKDIIPAGIGDIYLNNALATIYTCEEITDTETKWRYKGSLVQNINTQLSELTQRLNAAIGSFNGSPKGTYATLALLQAAYPTGASGVYTVTADGKWYYWNNTTWAVGGIYQGTGISLNSVGVENTNFLTRGKNLYNKNMAQDGYALNNAANNYVPYVNGAATLSEYILVSPNTSYYCNYNNGYIVYYDSNKVVISGVQYPAYPITTPSGCYYVRFHTTIANKPSLQFEKGTAATLYEQFTPFYTPLASLPKDITTKIPDKSLLQAMYGLKSINTENVSFLTRGKNLFDMSLCLDNYALNNAANKYAPYANTGATLSDYITVEPNTSYYCNYNNGYIVYYDLNKNVISGVQYPAYPITTPAGCYYVRFHTTIVNKPSLQFEKGTVGSRYLPFLPIVIPSNELQTYWYDKIWATEGDSITFNGSYQAGVRSVLQMHYINYGISGTTISDNGNTNAMVNRFTEIDINANLITFTGGTNDYSQNIPIGTNSSTDKTTFKGALKAIIEGVTARYPNARLAFFTPIQRGDISEGANLLGLTIKDYADAIQEICRLYGIPVLDLFGMSGINKLNINVFTSDKIHPNLAGYAVIIRLMIEFIKSL